MSNIIEQLSAPFNEHKQRSGGGGRKLTYVAIDQMLNRANEVLGLAWSSELISMHDDGGRCLIALKIHVNTEDGTVTRVGIGGSDMKDTDDRGKSALAEALKKGFNQFGMGLYLWDETHLDAIQKEEFTSEPPRLSLDAKKRKLLDLWKKTHPGEEASADSLREFYDVKDFNDEPVVDGLLKTYKLDA